MTRKTQATQTRKRLTQAERTALSDTAMFDAATALILEKGTVNTTLREIGERANYSRGLASYRFGTKERLFTELLSRIERKWAEAFRAEVADRRGLDAFRRTLEMYDNFIVNDTASYRAAMLIRYEMLGSSPTSAARSRRVVEIQRRQIATWIEEAVEDGDLRSEIDPQAFAVRHISFLYGTMYQLILMPDMIASTAFVDGYLQSVLAAYGRDQVSAGL